MTLPANIRVNALFPFPATVQGSGPVVISKANGIWTVGFTFTGLAVSVPSVGAYPTDFFLLYDSVAKTYSQVSLTTLINAASASITARTQRSVTSAPSVLAGDSIINFNLAAPANLPLPTAASRAGTPLTINDAGGQFGANPLTVTPNGTDSIAGTFTNAVPMILRTPRQVVTLYPYNDSVNAGWFIA